MQISFCNSNDKHYQRLLNDLLTPIFLDFKFWYDLNLWDSNYESYSIMKNDKIISNICVYKTDILLNGKKYPALSVGAVATEEEYKGKGYSRRIMEHIINKYPDVPMYLSANETVIDFYPRFGFERIFEKLPVAQFKIHNEAEPRKLVFDDQKVWDYVYKRNNYSSKLDCLNTASINLFHIHLGYLKDCIYDIPELDTIIIAEQNEGILRIIGVFSLRDIAFENLAKYLPFKNVSKIEFGFIPYWNDLEFEMNTYETDPLFVRNVKCELGDFKFPELSVT